MSPLMDAFTVELKRSGAADRPEEVATKIREKLAEDVQRELRTQADLGISGANPNAIEVKATETGMVIRSDNSMAVVEEITRRTNKEQPQQTKSIEDLFTQSSGVPELVESSNGTTVATFRTISLEDALGEQTQRAAEFRRNTTIQRAVQNNIGTRVSEAMKEIDDMRRGEP